MKFLDPASRKIVYINGNSVRTEGFSINAREYLALELKDRLDYIKAMLEPSGCYEDCAAVLFSIHLSEGEEANEMLNDDEVIGLFSNIAVTYASKFEKQKNKVIMPKPSLVERVLATPATVIVLTVGFIVDKPVQVVLHRKVMNKNGEMLDAEEIRMVS